MSIFAFQSLEQDIHCCLHSLESLKPIVISTFLLNVQYLPRTMEKLEIEINAKTKIGKIEVMVSNATAERTSFENI